MVGCRWKCLCALTWSSASPVARNASNCAAISAASWRRDARAERRCRARAGPCRCGSGRSLSTRSGMLLRAAAPARPRPATRCSPTRRFGSRRARSTASAAAGAADHQARGGQDAVAVRRLDGLVDLGREAEIVGGDDQRVRWLGLHLAPSKLGRPLPSETEEGGVLVYAGLLPLAQELEELDALAQAALHHLRASAPSRRRSRRSSARGSRSAGRRSSTEWKISVWLRCG